MQFLDVYTILLIVVAVAIFLRLRSVLGRRTGNERPPFDPYSAQHSADAAREAGRDNVVALPRSGGGVDAAESVPDVQKRVSSVAEEGSPLFDKLKTLVEADPSFDPKQFLQGANAAYEMIVTAFANGDRKTLRPLLSDDVFAGFEAAISDRESRGEKMSSTLIGIDRSKIIDGVVKGQVMQVTVRFSSQMISATYDKDGTLVEGDPKKVIEVTDVWTFSRDIRSDDPNWKLVATESA